MLNILNVILDWIKDILTQCIQDTSQRRVPKSEWTITENAHEAIVTKEEFESANAMILPPLKYEHKPKGTADAVFYCGHCGRKLQRTHGNDIYFSCAQHKYQDGLPCRGALEPHGFGKGVASGLSRPITASRTKSASLNLTYKLPSIPIV